jgi:hypothetical protein
MTRRDFGFKLYDFEKENGELELKLVSGGSDSTFSDDKDWLSKLDIGTVFLVQDRTSPDFNLGLFRLVDKIGRACVLQLSINREVHLSHVNPSRFCNKYIMYENLGKIEDVRQPE